jgi:hypothetical protein
MEKVVVSMFGDIMYSNRLAGIRACTFLLSSRIINNGICTGDHDAQEEFYTRLGAHDGTPPLLSHLATFSFL